METSLSQSRTGDKNYPHNKPIFNVVIAYEDFAAGKHAKETYDYLVHHLGREFEFENQMWKFDVLGNPKMKEMAVKDAATADLIIISTHGVGDLPREVKSWIDHWVEHKGSAMALVTLVDRPPGENGEVPPIRTYLQRVARKAKMDFFAQPDDWPDKDEDFSMQQISERAQRTSTLMADFLHHHTAAGSRWGLNE